ncbi:MAG: PQQ-binding-like beta-propeller repeat protein, partial [Proteobacteria bacterium]|nr:PQQ-binding-like beta-propeller repeat protein [Pseudomonadota bacterium]
GMGLPVPVAKPQSGTQWSFSPRSHWNRFNVSPAVTPERLFIGDNSGRFYALDAKSGSLVWDHKEGNTNGKLSAAPLAFGSYVCFGTDDGNLHVLKQDSGEALWTLPLGSPLAVAPVFASGMIYVRTSDKRLYAIE